MNTRDDFFYQAVIYAKEKNYAAARAMLRNLLFQYPNDIEGLLLYSIVAKNREGSIQALKRILQIDPDHEIAFTKLAKLKYAPPSSIPTPMAPLPLSNPNPDPTPPTAVNPVQQPKAPEEVIPRKILEPSKTVDPRYDRPREKRKKKRNIVDSILIGLLIITCLCLSFAAMQEIFIYLASGF